MFLFFCYYRKLIIHLTKSKSVTCSLSQGKNGLTGGDLRREVLVVDDLSVNRIISRIYKELLQLNNKKTMQLKMREVVKWAFLQRGYIINE